MRWVLGNWISAGGVMALAAPLIWSSAHAQDQYAGLRVPAYEVLEVLVEYARAGKSAPLRKAALHARSLIEAVSRVSGRDLGGALLRAIESGDHERMADAVSDILNADFEINAARAERADSPQARRGAFQRAFTDFKFLCRLRSDPADAVIGDIRSRFRSAYKLSAAGGGEWTDAVRVLRRRVAAAFEKREIP